MDVACVCVCVCEDRACRCPAAACPAWLKSSEKTMANRDEASLCCELTQPKDLSTVNMACTRSTGERNPGHPSAGQGLESVGEAASAYRSSSPRWYPPA